MKLETEATINLPAGVQLPMNRLPKKEKRHRGLTLCRRNSLKVRVRFDTYVQGQSGRTHISMGSRGCCIASPGRRWGGLEEARRPATVRPRAEFQREVLGKFEIPELLEVLVAAVKKKLKYEIFVLMDRNQLQILFV